MLTDKSTDTIMDLAKNADYVANSEEPQAKLNTVAAADSITLSRISPVDKLKIDGQEYVKSSALGGTERGILISWI